MIFPWTGSAKTLIGDCKMVCVFASDDECEVWSEEAKEEIKENVEKAWNWIVKMAEEHGIELNPQTEYLNEDEDVTYEFIPDADSKKGDIVTPFESMIQQLGYESNTDFYESVKEESVNTHFIFFINKYGRSYASTLNINHADTSLEINVNFSPDVFTIIHETLHAYGAIDLYNVHGTPEGAKAEKYAYKHFPNEVMLCKASSLEELEISPLNTLMIGWHREFDETFLKLVTPEARGWIQEMVDNIENFDQDGNLIVDTMEEVAVYVSEEGIEFHRYQINGTESIYLWKEFGSEYDEDGEGYTYKELFTFSEDSTYRLIGLVKPDIIDIPIDGGTVRVGRCEEEFKDYCEVTLQED